MLFSGSCCCVCVDRGVPGEEAVEHGGGGGGGAECRLGKWEGGDNNHRCGQGVEWWTKYFALVKPLTIYNCKDSTWIWISIYITF